MSERSAVPTTPIDLSQLCERVNLPAVRSLAFDSAFGPVLGGVVHELRNQLQSVTGVLPLVLEGSADDVPASLRTMASVGVDRSLAAVQALTSLLELRREDPPGPTPVADIVQFVSDLHPFRRHPYDSAIDVQVEVTEPAGCNLFDGASALMLLANNAMDAMRDRDDGRMRIRTSTDAAQVTIEVRDEGDGFDVDPIERAFAPYVSTRPRRAGLGLPLARALIAHVGGVIELVPSDAAGSCVRMRVPAWRAPA